MAEIEVISSSADSLTMQLCKLQEDWAQGERTTSWQLGGFWKSGANIPNNAPSGGQVTFSGLESGTEYYVFCEVYFGSTWLATIDGYVTTDSEWEEPEEPDEPSVNIAKWDWAKSNGTASEDAVYSTWLLYVLPELYNATNLFSYQVWNDMVDKVAEIRRAMGWYWDDTYAYQDDTKMLYGDYRLYAYQFNSIRNNIEMVGKTLGVKSTIPDKVYSGDDVFRDYFITLTDYMNECIDNL